MGKNDGPVDMTEVVSLAEDSSRHMSAPHDDIDTEADEMTYTYDCEGCVSPAHGWVEPLPINPAEQVVLATHVRNEKARLYRAAAARFDGADPWDICAKGAPVEGAIPLGCIRTLPATGSEMNGGSVVTHEARQEK